MASASTSKFFWGFLFAPLLCIAAPASENPEGKVNFPSNFQVDRGIDLFVTGDYLYWVAEEDGLYFAQAGKSSGTTTLPPAGNNFNGRLLKVDPKWQSAFRIGAGLNFPRAGYDITALWTCFETEASREARGSLLPAWAYPDNDAFSLATYAKSQWNLEMQCVDLEWGRSSWFGNFFSLRPYTSLRWLWVEQDLKNTYSYATAPVATGMLRADARFNGGGLRAGALLRFSLPHDFSLYGNVSGALLYGKMLRKLLFKENEITIAESKGSPWVSASTLQLALGVSWDRHFLKDRCHIELHVGWEQNGFFGVSRMEHALGQLGSGKSFEEKGSLTLQGLVAGGRFDF